MNNSILQELLEAVSMLRSRIQAYADRNNISFEEAEKRANIMIDGRTIRIIKVKDEDEEKE